MNCDSNERQYPNVAKSGGRFDLSLLKKEEGQNEHSAEKQPDTTQPYALRLCRYIAPGRTRRRGSVFAALRRDKAGGGTRQRKREAGGTPGGVSPLVIKNQSAFSTQPFN